MLFPHLAVCLIGAGMLAPATGSTPVAPAVTAVASSPTLTLRARAEEVHVVFSARDGNRLVRGLAPDRLTVVDNGQAPAAITTFQQDSALPLRIALVIDHSDSMQRRFAEELRAARQFLEQSLRPSIDSAVVVDFSIRASVSGPISNGAQLKPASLDRLEASGQTALYDAIFAAAHALGRQATPAGPVRRVILLLSDGEDNYSRASLAEAIEAAQRNEVAVYAVTAHNSHYEYQGDSVLRRLADTTGGRAFILKSYDGVERVFADIEGELRAQYSMTFRPPTPRSCGYHTIRIVPSDRKLHIHARDGYYACTE